MGLNKREKLLELVNVTKRFTEIASQEYNYMSLQHKKEFAQHAWETILRRLDGLFSDEQIKDILMDVLNDLEQK